MLNFQTFNLTTQSWSVLTTNPPSPLYKSACIVLPTSNILVVGGVFNVRQAMLYNPATNVWTALPNTNNDQGGASLVQLKQRVFVVGGLSTTAEEFNYFTNTWTNATALQAVTHQGYTGALEVPADMFSSRTGGCTGL
jgi:hypothetical protein